jgi:hypothetical protein
MDLTEMGWGMWTGFVWLRVGTSSGFLLKRRKEADFHKMLGIS